MSLSDDVVVDYGSDDQEPGLEVLNAGRVLGEGGTPVVELQNLMARDTGR